MTYQATLVTDGPSDVVLVRILEWLIAQLTTAEIEIRWADLRGLPERPQGLRERLVVATRLYPCHILFVHRDAENQDPKVRYTEIRVANTTGLGHVCIVPVRMQEAWLLHNEAALREAADRPSGTDPLDLPAAARWERLPDPKATLYNALRTASGATGRRAKRFRPARAAHRLAELITDWSPLRPLPAFAQLETDTKTALRKFGIVVIE
ncbi:conserved hypothetical protein [Candidatus Sulfopaludibacter sp. SbA4]|nr:conserved hypothetical protein [Candidatus Sulfopaludibacter sp. SbA4]